MFAEAIRDLAVFVTMILVWIGGCSAITLWVFYLHDRRKRGLHG